MPYLGARRDVADGELHLLAAQYLVDELACVRALERLFHEPVELAARRQLRGDPLEHVMPDKGAREVLRERSGEGLIEDARRLGCFEDVVRGGFDPSPPRSRRDARRIKRDASSGIRQPAGTPLL